MKNNVIVPGFIICWLMFACTTGHRTFVGSNTGLDKGSSIDTVNAIPQDSNSDPDGITGNASTYGTGTGVSGQTPSGGGAGIPNDGRSGVGIKKSIKKRQ